MPRIAKWQFRLQEYCCCIKYIPWIKNVMANCLSWLSLKNSMAMENIEDEETVACELSVVTQGGIYEQEWVLDMKNDRQSFAGRHSLCY